MQSTASMFYICGLSIVIRLSPIPEQNGVFKVHFDWLCKIT